jgi:hypothetical protein
MVRRVEDVEAVLELVAGRIGLGILVETIDAVANAGELARQPLARVFVGLNDLAIERGNPSIFGALIDGTVDDLRAAFDAPFGVAALTVPEGGAPLPCRLLIGELARVRCEFSILRRSFRRDIVGRELDVEVRRIRSAVTDATSRSLREIRIVRQELIEAVVELETSALRLLSTVRV